MVGKHAWAVAISPDESNACVTIVNQALHNRRLDPVIASLVHRLLAQNIYDVQHELDIAWHDHGRPSTGFLEE
jgi:hypothetical protein